MASKGDFSLITSAQMSTISFDRAKAILDEWVAPSNGEECKLDNACGRVVAAGLKSQSDLPPFDNSVTATVEPNFKAMLGSKFLNIHFLLLDFY